jgi:hypothetical protein
MHHIAHLCSHIADFQTRQGWDFKALPVITWEFGSISDFMNAKAQLMQQIVFTRQYHAQGAMERMLDPHTCELDCCGVTFRLRCLAVLDTEHGPFGAAELRVEDTPRGQIYHAPRRG